MWAYHKDLAAGYALTGRLGAARKELEAVERLSPGQTIAKSIDSAHRLSSNETFLKGVDHEIAGLRLAGMPDN